MAAAPLALLRLCFAAASREQPRAGVASSRGEAHAAHHAINTLVTLAITRLPLPLLQTAGRMAVSQSTCSYATAACVDERVNLLRPAAS
jgi:hypothetical protein